MSTTELLAELERRGVRMEARGDTLRFYPESVVPAELVECMKLAKLELLAMLRDDRGTLYRLIFRGTN